MNTFYSSAYTSKGFMTLESKYLYPDCFRYIMKGYPQSANQKIIKAVSEELDR